MKKGKFTCPYCCAEHDITDCGLQCSYNFIGNSDKKCKFGIKKYDDEYGFGWIPLAHKKKCISCKEAVIQIFCSDGLKEIPIEFLSMENLPIALLGTNFSGVSTYFGVLINEIRQKMSSSFNCSLLVACSKESKEAYDSEYYRPLYQDRCIVPKTWPNLEIPPLMFPLYFMDIRNKNTKRVALTFYDIASEILMDKTALYKSNRYITNSHGIFLFLDPLQLPNIRTKLTVNGFNALPSQTTDISDVFMTIVNLVRNVKKNANGLIPIPLALVLTKIDVLEQYNILPENSCLREESEHIKRGAYIMSDFENTNIQMQEMINNWLDVDLMGYIKQFKKYSFFGVSSLGENPNGSKLNDKGIHPRRVLDPFLWLLAEKGYIKILRK